jgi:mono/diheme cytochrome c family protein
VDNTQRRFDGTAGEVALTVLWLLRVLALATAAVCCSTAVAAQGEHAQVLAAELMVMAGDVRRLAAGKEPPLHLEGLRARLAGALSSLPVLLRRNAASASAVAPLRAAFSSGDWSTLAAGLDSLLRTYPFDAAILLPGNASPDRLRLGEAIHRQACAGCHTGLLTDTKLPAFDLFDQVRRMPREEFAARLLVGVRGDRSTAWRNPFSALELGALLAYYESGTPSTSR